ncbi:MAG: creatininase family protein [Alphaproteobacteria bacterium]|nr:creatininase family protein [Alphaproteobacteria bacterium]
MTVRVWEHLTTTDFDGDRLAGAVAVLPVAAVEQHGPHLPLGTDAILTDAVFDAAASRIGSAVEVLRLPTQRIGLSPEHVSFPGTLSLSAEMVISCWTEIGHSIALAGVRRLLILNGHGGQAGPVDIVATRLRAGADLSVLRCTYFALAGPETALPEREWRFGLHGGTLETSLMLHVAPDLVRMDQARDFSNAGEAMALSNTKLEAEGATGLGWMAEDLNTQGVTGDASAATATLGAELLDHIGSELATLIIEFAHHPLPAGTRRG